QIFLSENKPAFGPGSMYICFHFIHLKSIFDINSLVTGPESDLVPFLCQNIHSSLNEGGFKKIVAICFYIKRGTFYFHIAINGRNQKRRFPLFYLKIGFASELYQPFSVK